MGRRAWMLLAVVGVMAMAAVVAVSVLMGGCAKPVETAAGGTVPMKCHWTFVATTLVGAAGVVTAARRRGAASPASPRSPWPRRPCC